MNITGKGGKFGGGKGYGGGKVAGKGGGKGFQGKCWTCNETGHTMAECPQKPADGGKNAGKGGKSKKGKGKGKWGGKGTMNMLSEGDQTDFALCIDEKPDQRILDYLELMECSPCSGDGWKRSIAHVAVEDATSEDAMSSIFYLGVNATSSMQANREEHPPRMHLSCWS